MADEAPYRWIMGAGNIMADGLPPRPAWMDRAACVAADPHLFFPGKGESVAPAAAVCSHCAVREACLEYALAAERDDPLVRVGVWGGLSPNERAAIAQARRASAA